MVVHVVQLVVIVDKLIIKMNVIFLIKQLIMSLFHLKVT